MKTYALLIEIDGEELEVQFIDAEDLDDLKSKYEQGYGDTPEPCKREMDWDYDVQNIYEFPLVVPYPTLLLYKRQGINNISNSQSQ